MDRVLMVCFKAHASCRQPYQHMICSIDGPFQLTLLFFAVGIHFANLLKFISGAYTDKLLRIRGRLKKKQTMAHFK